MEQNISVKKLRFVIDEGTRSIVREIVISGNTIFSDGGAEKTDADPSSRLDA